MWLLRCEPNLDPNLGTFDPTQKIKEVISTSNFIRNIETLQRYGYFSNSQIINWLKGSCRDRTAWKMSKYGVFCSPYFPAFGLNVERYSVFLRIQSKCEKIRSRKNSVFGHFSRSVGQLEKTYTGNLPAKKYWNIIFPFIIYSSWLIIFSKNISTTFVWIYWVRQITKLLSVMKIFKRIVPYCNIPSNSFK